MVKMTDVGTSRDEEGALVSGSVGMGRAQMGVRMAGELLVIHDDIQIWWSAADLATRVLGGGGMTPLRVPR